MRGKAQREPARCKRACNWIKFHQIFIRHRGIIRNINVHIRLTILSYIVKCQSTE